MVNGKRLFTSGLLLSLILLSFGATSSLFSLSVENTGPEGTTPAPSALPLDPTSSITGSTYQAQAEELAQWLASTAVPDSGGWKWAEGGQYYSGLDKGAAGIGMFFIDLYRNTHNQTYLTNAGKAASWLMSADIKSGPGNFTEKEGSTAVLTGYYDGLAGIADFFLEMYKCTGLGTYLLQVQEITAFLNSKRVDEYGYSKYPWKITGSPVGLLEEGPDHVEIWTGDNTSQTLAEFDDDGNTYDVGSVSFRNNNTNPRALDDPQNETTLSLGVVTTAAATAKKYVVQTFRNNSFPIDLDDNGLSVWMYADSGLTNAEVRAGIFEWQATGGLGNQVGGWSDAKAASTMGTSPVNSKETFTWGTNAPFINGTNTPGYALVLFVSNDAGEMTNNMFHVLMTNDSAYTRGRVYYSETGLLTGLTTQSITCDLVFEIAADVHQMTRSSFQVTLESFGINTDLVTSQDFKSLKIYFNASHNLGGSLDYSGIFLEYLGTWIPLGDMEITNTEKQFTVEITSNLYSYVFPTTQLVVITEDGAAHDLQVDFLHYEIFFDDQDYLANLYDGCAGIGRLLTRVYEVTGNQTYLASAFNTTRFLNYTRDGPSNYYWNEDTPSDTVLGPQRYFGYWYGVAGIGDFLLEYATHNASDPVTIAMISGIADWLTNEFVMGAKDSLVSAITGQPVYGSTTKLSYSDATFYTGYGLGAAGIGDFLLKVATFLASTTSNYGGYAINLFNFLTSRIDQSPPPPDTTSVCAYADATNRTYKIAAYLGSGNYYLDFNQGAAGIIAFFNNLEHSNQDSVVSRALLGVTDWLVAQLTPALYASGTFNKSMRSGAAGIGSILLKISPLNQKYTRLSETVMSHFVSFSNDYSALVGVQEAGVAKFKNRSMPLSAYDYGLYAGTPGIGRAYLDLYRRTLYPLYIDVAIKTGDLLTDIQYWKRCDGDGRIFTGIDEGVAGKGLYLLELYGVTHDAAYLTSAQRIADWLADDAAIKTGNNWSWPEYYDDVACTTPAPTRYYGYAKGSAGIIEFYLEMARSSGNLTYLEYARYGGNYLNDIAQTAPNLAKIPVSSTSTAVPMGYDMGHAGMGDVLLRLGTALKNNDTFISLSRGLLNWIDATFEPSVGLWVVDYETMVTSPDYATSHSMGAAGIIEFYLNTYEHTAEAALFNRAAVVAGTLTTANTFTIIDANGARWRLSNNLNIVNYGYSNGSAGIVDTLLRLYALTGNTTYLDVAILGSSYLYNVNPTGALFPQADGVAFQYTGYAWGSAGITPTLLKIPDFTHPVIQTPQFSLPLASIPFSQNLTVSVNAYDVCSDLTSVVLYASVQQPGQGLVSSNVALTASGITYSHTFPGWQYGTVVWFYFEVTDAKGYVSVDNNQGALYTYTVQDPEAPTVGNATIMNSRSGGQSLEYGQTNGIVNVTVTKSVNSSALTSVALYYNHSASGGPHETPMTLGNYAGATNWTGTINAVNWTYQQQMTYFVVVTDVAGHTVAVNNTVTFLDYTPPTVSYVENLTQREIMSNTPVTLKARASDPAGGAGISPQNGVFLAVSYDGGYTWREIPMPFDDTQNFYVGTIPGRSNFDVDEVRYVLGVRDQANNTQYLGDDGNYYSQLSQVPILAQFFYRIRMNWTTPIIVIVVVAAMIVLVYFIYTRRGSYWDQMRRKATGKATRISVQEAFRSAGYWLVGKFEAFGRKLRGTGEFMGSRREKLADWYDDHVSDRLKKIIDFFLFLFGLAVVSFSMISWTVFVPFVSESVYVFGFGFLIACIGARHRKETKIWAFGVGLAFLLIGLLSWIFPIPLFTTTLSGEVCGLILIAYGRAGAKKFGTFLKRVLKPVGEKVFLELRGGYVAILVIAAVAFIVAPVVRFFEAAAFPLGVIWLINFGFVLFIAAFLIFIIHLILKLVYK